MYSKKFENPSFLNTNPNSISSMNTNGVNIVSRRTIVSIILSNAVLLSHRSTTCRRFSLGARRRRSRFLRRPRRIC